MRHVSEEKRTRLLEAGAEVFAQKGYYPASIKEITQLAGVSVGTFYLYFPNKEELLLALYRRMAAALADMLQARMDEPEPDARAKLLRCTIALILCYRRYAQLSLILLTQTIGMSPVFEQEYYRFFATVSSTFETLLAALKQQGQMEFAPLDIAAMAYLQIVNGLTAQWLAAQDGKSLDSLVKSVVCYNFRALSIAFSEEELERELNAQLEGETA